VTIQVDVDQPAAGITEDASNVVVGIKSYLQVLDFKLQLGPPLRSRRLLSGQKRKD
jgi:hypothetical protein